MSGVSVADRWVGGAAKLLDKERQALLGGGLVCQTQLAQRYPRMRLHNRSFCLKVAKPSY